MAIRLVEEKNYFCENALHFFQSMQTIFDKKKRCSGKIIYIENLIRGNILLACRMMITTGACSTQSRVSKHCACMKRKMIPGKNETKRAWNLLCHAKESVRRAQNRKLRLREQRKGCTVLVFCNACTNSSYFCQLHDPEDFS